MLRIDASLLSINNDFVTQREFLWSFPTMPLWATLSMSIGFFTFIGPSILLILQQCSRTHTWCLPIFALGLGIPRWAQVSEGMVKTGFVDILAVLIT